MSRKAYYCIMPYTVEQSVIERKRYTKPVPEPEVEPEEETEPTVE